MSLYQYLVTLPMVILIHYCSPTPALNWLPPPAGTTEARDISYADGPRHKLDVYVPGAAANPAPVVVFFYGGGWTTGSREWYRFVGSALVSRGLLVVIPDYRLYPQVRFPAFMDDAAEAVAWARSNAARWGGDPHRLFLMGHSAGAQIATLLALDPGYLTAVGLSPSEICGVIGLAGPYDFLPLATENLKAIFGKVPDLARTQPINFITAHAPPMLLLAGLWDTSVDPSNTSRLAARLRSFGVPATVRMYYGLTHTALIESETAQFAFISPVREDTLNFIAAHGACGE